MKTTLAALFFLALPILSSQVHSKDIVRDPEFVRMHAEFGDQWQADDIEVQKKLKALEARFGKKPNVVFILADDVHDIRY